MNLVKRTTGMARVIRKSMTQIYQLEDLPSLPELLKKYSNALAICHFKVRIKTI